VHHVGILYDQFMMHGQRNIKSFQLIVNIVTLPYYSIFFVIQTAWGEKWKYKYEKHAWSKI